MDTPPPPIHTVEHRYAGVFLITPSNKVIGQKRDDKPTIDNPGKVSSFGGEIEAGETPQLAAWRELVQEETNLTLKIEDIIPLHADVAWRKLTGEWEARYFYIAHISNHDANNLEIYEGQGWAYINGPEDEQLVDVLKSVVAKLHNEILQ